MGGLQRDPMVFTICKDFLQIVRIFCHDLTNRSCPRLTPLSSVVRAFAHGAMGDRINPSWWTH